ncbi:MAG: hypothetical protein Q8942_13305 [Bacillota bacterium]|nr:hypothetical protein [Bacillota bacterium]
MFIVITIVGIIYGGVLYVFGNTQIGSVFEKEKYSEIYYVNMFPDNSKSKNYKVKAEIMVSGGVLDRNFTINKAYFSNGGYITFYNNLYEFDIDIGKNIDITDDKGRDWKIELTTQKVEA